MRNVKRRKFSQTPTTIQFIRTGKLSSNRPCFVKSTRLGFDMAVTLSFRAVRIPDHWFMMLR